jgi:hypothetical protein
MERTGAPAMPARVSPHRGVRPRGARSWRLGHWLARLALLAGLSLAGTSWAASTGEVRGVVHDAGHRPLAGALVELHAASSAWSRSSSSDAAGEFIFSAVPVGEYQLKVTQSGFASALLPLTVIAGAAPSTHVQLAAGEPAQTITISAAAAGGAESFTPTTLVSRGDIAVTPGADRSNSLAMITDFVPGAYVVHDQLHVRGGHQVSWQIDGVQIPNTNIASNLGPQIDPKDIDYLEVQRGSYAADDGDRTYGVFNVVPRTGFEREHGAELVVSAGNYGQTNDQVSVGSHSDDFAYYASVNGNRSDLGLMTPSAAILHDTQYGYGAFSTLIYNVDAADQLRLIASARRDSYQIPNSPGQSADDVQQEADAFTLLSWGHTFTRDLVLTSSFFYHYNRADLDGAPRDYPISTTYQHASSYVGGQESARLHLGDQQLDAGVVGFSQSDDQLFHVLFNDGSNPPLLQSLHPGGNLEAAYLQDTYRATPWLTLSGGVRQSHFAGGVHENATDPRLGFTIEVPTLNWVVRGFWGRYYQAPPLETLAGPLLQFAQANALGFLPLHGERDQEMQFGVTVPLGGWIIDVDHSRTQARNFFDHNPIGNSDVFLPITIDGALIKANELTLRSPRWHGLRLHLAYSNQTADGSGAISGGLTDFEPAAATFALDHDQRNTVNAGLDAELPQQVFAALNLYYGSGFANGDAPPSHLPGHASVDVSLGKRITPELSASLSVLNLTNRHLLIDNSLTFDGFHYDNPLEIYAELHYKFHY